MSAESERNSVSTLNFNFVNEQSLEKLKEANRKLMLWLKRIGWVGFTFFLVKGLVWIAVWLGLARFFEW